MPFAYAAYAGLFGSVWVLAYATNLNGYWQIVVVAMLLGYLVPGRKPIKLQNPSNSAPNNCQEKLVFGHPRSEFFRLATL
jgi:hypothetical protein